MDPRERLNDPQDAIRTAILGTLAGVWTAIPGIVVSVNYDALTVVVQPSLKAVVEDKDGTYRAVALPVLPDVPVYFPKGGGCVLTFPVKQGDEALVVFASRAIDTWWQQGGVQMPNHSRQHDLSDGFALIGPYSQPRKFGAWSQTTAQFRSESGATFVEIDPSDGFVNVTTPGNINATAGAKITGTAGDSINLTAPTVQLNGHIVLNGPISQPAGAPGGTAAAITGPMTVAHEVTANGIPVSTHTHSDPQGGNTGPPNP